MAGDTLRLGPDISGKGIYQPECCLFRHTRQPFDPAYGGQMSAARDHQRINGNAREEILRVLTKTIYQLPGPTILVRQVLKDAFAQKVLLPKTLHLKEAAEEFLKQQVNAVDDDCHDNAFIKNYPGDHSSVSWCRIIV